MNKTENLKLNVWEKSDPILVGDFNEDNRKIDAAVGPRGQLQNRHRNVRGRRKVRQRQPDQYHISGKTAAGLHRQRLQYARLESHAGSAGIFRRRQQLLQLQSQVGGQHTDVVHRHNLFGNCAFGGKSNIPLHRIT